MYVIEEYKILLECVAFVCKEFKSRHLSVQYCLLLALNILLLNELIVSCRCFFDITGQKLHELSYYNECILQCGCQITVTWNPLSSLTAEVNKIQLSAPRGEERGQMESDEFVPKSGWEIWIILTFTQLSLQSDCRSLGSDVKKVPTQKQENFWGGESSTTTMMRILNQQERKQQCPIPWVNEFDKVENRHMDGKTKRSYLSWKQDLHGRQRMNFQETHKNARRSALHQCSSFSKL